MNFRQLALDAGFNEEQASFLEQHFAPLPHTHSMGEVEGLEEALEELEEDEEVLEDD